LGRRSTRQPKGSGTVVKPDSASVIKPPSTSCHDCYPLDLLATRSVEHGPAESILRGAGSGVPGRSFAEPRPDLTVEPQSGRRPPRSRTGRGISGYRRCQADEQMSGSDPHVCAPSGHRSPQPTRRLFAQATGGGPAAHASRSRLRTRRCSGTLWTSVALRHAEPSTRSALRQLGGHDARGMVRVQTSFISLPWTMTAQMTRMSTMITVRDHSGAMFSEMN
jgi:hypothetical protein